jgi:hypothetical protein
MDLVEWVVAEGSDKPGSFTKVKPSTGGTDSHGQPLTGSTNDTNKSMNWALHISISSMIIALLSLIMNLRKKSTK